MTPETTQLARDLVVALAPTQLSDDEVIRRAFSLASRAERMEGRGDDLVDGVAKLLTLTEPKEPVARKRRAA